MKIHLDNIIYSLQSEGGISTFWNEITTRISKKQGVITTFTHDRKLYRFFPVISISDVFHSSYFRKPISLSRNVKTVVTIHDLIYEELIKSRKDLNIRLNCWQRRKAIQKADAIVCISHATKELLLEFYPDLKARLSDISVIYHGISFSQSQISQVSIPSSRLSDLLEHTNNRYVIFVGGRNSYKNFDLALEGFRQSQVYKKESYYFVCTGKPFNPEEVNLIARLKLADKVKVVPYATEEELISLYKNSHALLYISSQEGFGLPPLEAMSCKCPVVTSTCKAVLEIVDNASIVIDTNDISSIATAIDLLSEKSIRQKYISLGESRVLAFDWDVAANQYLEIYKSLKNV